MNKTEIENFCKKGTFFSAVLSFVNDRCGECLEIREFQCDELSQYESELKIWYVIYSICSVDVESIYGPGVYEIKRAIKHDQLKLVLIRNNVVEIIYVRDTKNQASHDFTHRNYYDLTKAEDTERLFDSIARQLTYP